MKLGMVQDVRVKKTCKLNKARTDDHILVSGHIAGTGSSANAEAAYFRTDFWAGFTGRVSPNLAPSYKKRHKKQMRQQGQRLCRQGHNWANQRHLIETIYIWDEHDKEQARAYLGAHWKAIAREHELQQRANLLAKHYREERAQIMLEADQFEDMFDAPITIHIHCLSYAESRWLTRSRRS